VLWAVCQSDQVSRQSFQPLRNWLFSYFGFTPNQPLHERYQIFDRTLHELLASLPEAALAQEVYRTRSVLGALLDLHWVDSLYEQLDAEGRYNNTFLALIALLKAESLRQPVVLFLEDLQLTDPDSRDLLVRLRRSILAAGQAYPIAMIVTTRPPALGLAKDVIEARITLRGLTADEIAHLAELKLGGPPDPGLARFLSRRSEGNPYFAEQIIRYLQEESLIETARNGWKLVRELDATFLPGDIRSVLVARLDQLPRDVRESVQMASVLGRRFDIPLLSHMWGEDERLSEHIVEAGKAAIWSPLDETHYFFSHGLLRDAAYDMQMQARRKELHALAVVALEQLYPGAKNRYAELAHHAKYADLREKAQTYYILAGRMAADSYQNSQAVDYYTRALSFTSSDEEVRRFEILADRLELYGRMGKRDLQRKDLDTLERWAQTLGDLDRTAQVWMLRAAYHFAIGEFLQAVDCAQRAESLSPQMTNTALGLYTQLVWSQALLRLGRLGEAMQHCQAALQRHRADGNRKEEARALTSMGLIALDQGQPAQAETYLVQAVEAAREVNDLALQGKAFNNLAVLEGSIHGDFIRAQRYYEEAHKAARETGDRQTECITLGNLGFVAGMQGDFRSAHRYHEQALQMSREVGNRYQEMYTLINLSAVMELQHESKRAIEYAEAAAALAQQTSERSAEAWSMLYLGHAHLLENELDRAEAAFRSSLQIREELDQPSLSMEPLAGLVETYLRADDMAGAAREAERILGFISGGGTLDGTDEPLRVYHICHRFLQRTGDPRADHILEIACGLLEARVSQMEDDTIRRRYIESTPWRQALWDWTRANERS
jgi:predicted ATPase